MFFGRSLERRKKRKHHHALSFLLLLFSSTLKPPPLFPPSPLSRLPAPEHLTDDQMLMFVFDFFVDHSRRRIQGETKREQRCSTKSRWQNGTTTLSHFIVSLFHSIDHVVCLLFLCSLFFSCLSPLAAPSKVNSTARLTAKRKQKPPQNLGHALSPLLDGLCLLTLVSSGRRRSERDDTHEWQRATHRVLFGLQQSWIDRPLCCV